MDGAHQVKRKGEDDIPDWPQPQGIKKATHFYPIEFLKTLRDMYEMVVVRGQRSADLPMEYEAFREVVQRRTAVCSLGYMTRSCCRPLPTASWCSATDASTFASTACVMTDSHAVLDGSCNSESYLEGFG